MTEVANEEPSFSDRQGRIGYLLGLYGADGLNNLMTLIYWVMLVGGAIGIFGGVVALLPQP